MPDFVEAIDLDALPPGKSTTVSIDDKNVALYNVGGEVYATDDACIHAGSSLGWGILEGKVVRCRAHGMRFDVTTGNVVGSTDIGVRSYPTRIANGKVLVCPD